ncbi:MAG: hypothetical protein AAF986_04295 [Pseudomonadota bacterium]
MISDDEALTKRKEFCIKIRNDIERYRERLRNVEQDIVSAQQDLDDYRRDRILAGTTTALAVATTIASALVPLSKAAAAARAASKSVQSILQGGRATLSTRELFLMVTGVGTTITALKALRESDRRVNRAIQSLEKLDREADIIRLALTDLEKARTFRGCGALS